MTTEMAQAELAHIKSLFRLLPDTAMVYDEWETLVARHSVSGRNTYDARIAAAMTVHGITHLLTFNGADFKRYPGITVISPGDVK
jgi:predicted nucleic acid-binding protein